MNRRSLIKHAMTAATVSPFLRLGLVIAAQEFGAESVAILRQIARAVLPAELGARGVDDRVERFAAWVRAYREGAELEHGYGRPRIRYAPPSPIPTYTTQLRELDAAARARGSGFDALDRESQRAILDASLKAAGVDDLPARPMGRHVAADLMAHFFRSSEANDLAYRALIGQQQCRPVTFVVERPRPR
ncbi:MAG TPA: hypothetical protein VMO26_16105 [Vicinamibacterales bacterium]|nr:hypothetical protein [Vicinamibacterales bacterium]